MFGKKTVDFSSEEINSIIGSDAVIEGSFTTKDTTRIDGTIKGNVDTRGTLIIGPKGRIEGNVQAANVLVAGEVRGDMNVAEKIEASSSGKIIGDIQAKSLVIDENAMFQGRCTMNVKNHHISGNKDNEEL